MKASDSERGSLGERVKSGIKTVVPELLPESLVHEVKKKYYRWSVPRVTPRDEPALAHLPRFARPGDEVVDVGANFGVYSCALSRLVGRNGRVFAFEPIPTTFSILRHVAESFPEQNCWLFQNAVGDVERLLEMEIPLYQGGRENYYRARVSANREEGALRRFHVPATTLDKALLPLANRVTFLKIDVEGEELRVVQGATALLSRDRPPCLIEVSTDPDTPTTDGAKVFEHLKQLGYEPHIFYAGRILPRRSGEHATDYLFLPRDSESLDH